jgi:hypothetical protein
VVALVRAETGGRLASVPRQRPIRHAEGVVAMRGQRPLIIGMVLATLWVLAHATWHVSQRQGESDRLEPVAGRRRVPSRNAGGR